MLLTSSPVLIDAKASRAFLEAAQQMAGRLFRVLRVAAEGAHADMGTEIDAALEQLHRAAAPLVEPLNHEQRAAVNSAVVDP